MSLIGRSVLLTTSTTGLPDLRSMSATLSSASCRPCFKSTMNRITSAMSIAACACSRICDRMMSLLSGSMPPVSISVNS